MVSITDIPVELSPDIGACYQASGGSDHCIGYQRRRQCIILGYSVQPTGYNCGARAEPSEASPQTDEACDARGEVMGQVEADPGRCSV